MKRRIAGDEVALEWKELLRLSELQAPSVDYFAVTNDNLSSGHNGGNGKGKSASLPPVDPFDCSDVAVLPTFELVEQVIQNCERKWGQLDDRKILSSCNNSDEKNAEDSTKLRGVSTRQVRFQDDESREAFGSSNAKSKRRRGGGWRYAEDRLRLPKQFDYATLGSKPVDDGTGQRLVSLTGVGQTFSYERELWKMFASIPSARELEEDARSNAKVDNTMALQQEIASGMKKYVGMDGHSLSRLRMSNRHGFPPTSTSKKMGNEVSTTPMLRFECWRRQLRRNPSSDSNRLALEFLADQTLFDFHSALAQLLEDDLWDENLKDEQKNRAPSGCFFIEDQFYKHGAVDYAKPIIDWIDGELEQPHPARRGYLGMSSMDPMKASSMKETRLGAIPMRLGYRYYHVCHGDVETAVFLVDRRLTIKATVPYPIIHDIWAAGYVPPTCDACKHSLAIFAVAASSTETDGGPRALCDHCSKELKVPIKSLQLFSAWRREGDLSTCIVSKATRFF